MKNLIFIFLVFSFCAPAQDTIISKTGTKIISLVLLVGQDSIRYKKIENITGPDLYVYNSEVNLIKYKNGRVINIDSLYKKNTVQKAAQQQNVRIPIDLKTNDSLQGIAHDNSIEMYKEGVHHAEVNYRCKGCNVTFFSMGLVFGPVAFLSAVSVALTKVPDKKLAYPSESLWQNKDYQKGYKDKAGAIKRRSIYRGTTVGVIFSVFTTTLLVNILSKR